MSDKSNSNQQASKDDTNNNAEELSNDLDFWNIDTDKNDTDSASDELAELEKILGEGQKTQRLRSLSEQDPAVDIPSEKNIISSLEKLDGKQNAETLPNDSSHSDDASLTNSSAEKDAASQETNSSETSPKPQSTKNKIKFNKSPVEKMATLFCYLAIVGVFTYLIIYASKQHNFDTSKSYEANTPASGDYATIESVETWWSEPVGNNTKFGVVLVPSATITLGSDSKSGVIRSVFYSYEEGLNGQLRPKGDPLTHEFVDGRFLETDSNQITVHSTDGYRELAHFLFYRSQDEKRWTIEVKEASSSQTQPDGFKPLAIAPIEPVRK